MDTISGFRRGVH